MYRFPSSFDHIMFGNFSWSCFMFRGKISVNQFKMDNIILLTLTLQVQLTKFTLLKRKKEKQSVTSVEFSTVKVSAIRFSAVQFSAVHSVHLMLEGKRLQQEHHYSSQSMNVRQMDRFQIQNLRIFTEELMAWDMRGLLICHRMIDTLFGAIKAC